MSEHRAMTAPTGYTVSTGSAGTVVVETGHEERCTHCGERWPCIWSRAETAEAALADAQARIARLEAALMMVSRNSPYADPCWCAEIIPARGHSERCSAARAILAETADS